jgi:hypothetical protein
MDGGRSTRALVQGEDVRGKSQELTQLRVFGTDTLLDMLTFLTSGLGIAATERLKSIKLR